MTDFVQENKPGWVNHGIERIRPTYSACPMYWLSVGAILPFIIRNLILDALPC